MAHLERKAAALLLFTLALIIGSGLYLLYARGVFEPTQQLVLTADDSEGVVAGMDMTFSGFPIGRVRRTELAEGGDVRILIDVPRKDAHWLRESSVFTLVRGIVGGTTIKAYSGILTDPPLPDGAVRPVLRGDATAEIPQLMSAARELLSNLQALTAQDAALGGTLANVRTLTERLNAPGGALGVLMGSEAEARKIATTLDRTNQLLARIDGMAAKADRQVFGTAGEAGLVTDVRATVVQLNGLLADTRQSLAKVDAVLAEAQAIGANAREATTDLGALRADVESNLRKVESLVNEDPAQMALRARHPDRTAMSPAPTFRRPALSGRYGALLAAMLAAALATGCAQRPPAPEWELNARGAADRATQAYLSGNDRVAAQEWRRAREENRPHRAARPAGPCRAAGVRHAGRQPGAGGMPRLRAPAGGAAAAERAYADYLEGRAGGAEAGLLPPAQRAVQAEGTPALAGVADPLARLLAAAVLHVRGQGGPDVSQNAIDAASSQGWRRPLLAWLLLAEREARAGGDARRADQLRQRVDVLGQGEAAGVR